MAKTLASLAVVIVAATIVSVASIASAAEPAKSAAASQPAIVVDLSSPMATLRTNKAAMARGDAAVLKRCYYTADADEQAAIDMIMDSMAMQKQFERACAARWDAEAGERVAPEFNYQIPADAREEINGDSGVLYNIGGSRPTRLRRVNGEWRFTYASLVDNNFRDLPPMPPKRLASVFKLSVDLYRGLSDDVAAGKFGHVEDAMAAQRERREEVVKKIRALTNAPKDTAR